MRGSARGLAQAGVLLALLVLVHHRTFGGLWTTWSTNDNYSHGPLVPLTAAVMVFLRWQKFQSLPIAPDARGLGLIALACLMQVVGVRADLFALQCWSLLPLLFGASLTFLGRARTHMLAFPIAYLAFMLTFPPFVMNQLSYGLKDSPPPTTAGHEAPPETYPALTEGSHDEEGEKVETPETVVASGAPIGGQYGTRTRGLRRDRPAL